MAASTAEMCQLREKLAPQDRYCLAAQIGTFLVHTHSNHTALCQCLVSKKIALAQLPSPVRPKAAMGIRSQGLRLISGVMFLLLGEAFVASSVPLLIWFAIFVAVNVVYIPLTVESGLVKRFGVNYLAYKRNLPRWITRLKGCEGRGSPENQAFGRQKDLADCILLLPASTEKPPFPLTKSTPMNSDPLAANVVFSMACGHHFSTWNQGKNAPILLSRPVQSAALPPLRLHDIV